MVSLPSIKTLTRTGGNDEKEMNGSKLNVKSFEAGNRFKSIWEIIKAEIDEIKTRKILSKGGMCEEAHTVGGFPIGVTESLSH